ncbi:hypothetical protein VNI00_013477 [Paramarasmius palmivorus]|uniref:WD40 repeat-like protein n=1 Tax=Paramarasmius palmivorus TaxID=297713 RepID=A0AAW0C130_9AGAR
MVSLAFGKKYRLAATICGPQDSVSSLAFSEKCEFLAAGGKDGLRVWNVATTHPIPVPPKFVSPTYDSYKVGVCTWVFFESTSRHVLLLGTLDGDLIAWQYNGTKVAFENLGTANPKTTVKPVASMHVSDPNISPNYCARIVTSHENETVTVWKLTSDGKFIQESVFTFDPGFKPWNVRFGAERDIWAFSRDGEGRIATKTRKASDFNIRSSVGPKKMLYAALDPARDRMVISTGSDFRLMSMSKLEPLNTLKRSAPVIVPYPKQVAFVGNGEWIVAGTDSGHAAVYDVETAKLVQKLMYPKGGLVQTIACCAHDDWSYVAIAGSTSEQPSDVIIWRKRVRHRLHINPKLFLYIVTLLVPFIGIVFAFKQAWLTVSLPQTLVLSSFSSQQATDETASVVPVSAPTTYAQTASETPSSPSPSPTTQFPKYPTAHHIPKGLPQIYVVQVPYPSSLGHRQSRSRSPSFGRVSSRPDPAVSMGKHSATHLESDHDSMEVQPSSESDTPPEFGTSKLSAESAPYFLPNEVVDIIRVFGNEQYPAESEVSLVEYDVAWEEHDSVDALGDAEHD